MEQRTCETCGRIFAKARWNLGVGRYCSRECSHVKGGEHHPCPHCGTPIYRMQDEIRRGVHRYCSNACFSEYRKNRLNRICAVCGKSFQIQRYREAASRGRYCSKACYRLAKTSPLEDFVATALTIRGYDFERQKKFGPYFVDFYLPHNKLVVEVDGDYWHNLPAQCSKRKRRDAYLRACGVGIYHLTETAIRNDAIAFQMQFPLP